MADLIVKVTLIKYNKHSWLNGSTMAFQPRDPSLNLTRANQYKQILWTNQTRIKPGLMEDHEIVAV